MRQDYYNTLIYKKALVDWHNMSQSDQIKHTLKGTKVYRAYQRALETADDYIGSMLDGASRREEYINQTLIAEEEVQHYEDLV
jgi:hypothetical protein